VGGGIESLNRARSSRKRQTFRSTSATAWSRENIVREVEAPRRQLVGERTVLQETEQLARKLPKIRIY